MEHTVACPILMYGFADTNDKGEGQFLECIVIEEQAVVAVLHALDDTDVWKGEIEDEVAILELDVLPSGRGLQFDDDLSDAVNRVHSFSCTT